MPWVYHAIVEKKRWLTPQQFSELLGMGQILPGANVTNFAAMFGYRVAGPRGALAALGGLFIFPFFIVLGLGFLYQRYGSLPMVQGALRGVTAVACGLIFSTGLKLAKGQPHKVRSLIFGGLALLAVGFLHFSLPLVVLVLGLIAMASEWRAY